MFLFVNGEEVANADSTHPLLSREFLSQGGIFETVRIYNGVAFKLPDHIARFQSSALKLGIHFPPGVERIINNQVTVASTTGLRDAFLRVTLTPQGADASVLVTMIHDLPVLPHAWYEQGIRVGTSATRRNEFAVTSGVKTTAWLVSVLELRAAVVPGVEDAIFFDTVGHVSEGSASNIFLVVDGVLFTPPITCGALPGITRATVCALAKGMGLKVKDSVPIEPTKLGSAAEIFLTSSIREIVPVIAIDSHIVGLGIPGPWTRDITKAYQRVAV